MPARYSAIPGDEPNSPETSLKTYSRKVDKWVYIFDLIRAAVMVGLVGLNIDATVITKLRNGGESVVGLAIAMVGSGGMNRMQKVELGVTIFYVSSRSSTSSRSSHRLERSCSITFLVDEPGRQPRPSDHNRLHA